MPARPEALAARPQIPGTPGGEIAPAQVRTGLLAEAAPNTDTRPAKPSIGATTRTFAQGLLEAWQSGYQEKKEAAPGGIRQSAVAVIEGQPDGGTMVGIFNHVVKTTAVTTENPDEIITTIGKMAEQLNLKILTTA